MVPMSVLQGSAHAGIHSRSESNCHARFPCGSLQHRPRGLRFSKPVSTKFLGRHLVIKPRSNPQSISVAFFRLNLAVLFASPLLESVKLRVNSDTVFAVFAGEGRIRVAPVSSINGLKGDGGDGKVNEDAAVESIRRLAEQKYQAELAARISSGKFTVNLSRYALQSLSRGVLAAVYLELYLSTAGYARLK
eukprot:Gb_02886 [translate_table: standard]